MKPPLHDTRIMARVPHPENQPLIVKRIQEVLDDKYNGRQAEFLHVANAGKVTFQAAALSNVMNQKVPISIKQLRVIEQFSKARFEWLTEGVEPKYHPIGWKPFVEETAKEGEYFRAFMEDHKQEVTQTQLADRLGVKKSSITDTFKSTNIGSQKRAAILTELRRLLSNPDLAESEIFGPVLGTTPDASIHGRARLVRHVANFSAEPIAVLPFVPVRAQAGLATPQYWEHPPETMRIMQATLAKYEADPVNPKRSWWVIEVDGDSMETQLRSRDLVLGYYIGGKDDAGRFRINRDQLRQLKPGIWAIQYGDEFVLKRVRRNTIEEEGGVTVHPDNPKYDPFFIRAETIYHVWFIKKLVDSDIY